MVSYIRPKSYADCRFGVNYHFNFCSAYFSSIFSRSKVVRIENEESKFLAVYTLPETPTFVRDDDVCGICMDRQQALIVKVLPCNHRFHSRCLHGWFESQTTRKNKCPYCQNHLREQIKSRWLWANGDGRRMIVFIVLWAFSVHFHDYIFETPTVINSMVYLPIIVLDLVWNFRKHIL